MDHSTKKISVQVNAKQSGSNIMQGECTRLAAGEVIFSTNDV